MDQDREAGAARPAPGQPQSAAGKPTGGTKGQGEAPAGRSESTVESLVMSAGSNSRTALREAYWIGVRSSSASSAANIAVDNW